MAAATSRIVFTIAAAALLGSVSGCSRRGTHQKATYETTVESIEEVLREHTPQWMSIPGVVGTGIGECDGRPCIRIMVVQKTPELLKRIPSRVQGFVVDLVETGRFRARNQR